MYIEESSIDDILNSVYENLLKKENDERIVCTKGETIEQLGIYIKLLNPLARLSTSQTKGKAISPFGEFFWYLSKENSLEFISHYIPAYKSFSDDGLSVNGGYGCRIFNMHGKINQLEKIIDLLKAKPTTRKAVIQIYDAKDLNNKCSKDIPCTCTLQFFNRENKLHMFVYMRSNDAFLGLSHDIFCFTMIQEMVSCILGTEIGHYNHFVSSLHLYDKNIELAKQYLAEGFQTNKLIMPLMPKNNIVKDIKKVLSFEKEIREGKDIEINTIELPDYWVDVIVLLKIFSLSKVEGKSEEIKNLVESLKNDIFKVLIEEKYNL